MKRTLFALLMLVCMGGTVSAQKPKAATPAAPPAVRTADPNAVDLDAVTRIRAEAFRSSKVMDTLSEISDTLGPRLTNSPNQLRANQWAKEKLTGWGLENAHFEAWGPFGQGWSYSHSTVRMTAPDQAEFIALPKAWTPGTNGTVKGKVMRVRLSTPEDLEALKGKVAGAILLVGAMRDVPALDKPQMERYDEEELAKLAQYPIAETDRYADYRRQLGQRARFNRQLMQWLEDEKVGAVIEGSRSPGSGGTIFVQGGGSYRKGESAGAPWLVMAIEHFGRIWRLMERKTDVELEVRVDAQFHDGDPYGYNVIAEIPGTDLKDEVVVIGAHFDSWHGATGATDNAAGSAVVMEAMRILKAIGAKPRRTIRVALWTGEEQGLFGSRGYVGEHFGARKLSQEPGQQDLPDYMRRRTGPVEAKPGHAKIAAYFNLDNGTGRIRGVYMEENASVAPIFEKWMEPFRDVGMTTLTMRRTGGSDHVAFDEVGIPGFQFVQDEAEYGTRTHHSNMDSFERTQGADMQQASAIMAAFAYHAAMRDEKLPRKPLPGSDGR